MYDKKKKSKGWQNLFKIKKLLKIYKFAKNLKN